jgi:hypothetical protein
MLPAAALIALSVAAPSISATSARNWAPEAGGDELTMTINGPAQDQDRPAQADPDQADPDQAANNAALTNEIAQAVRTSPLTAALPASQLRITDVQVSRTDPNYAAAHIVPPADTTDTAAALLRRTNGHWTLVELGTAQVGCSGMTPVVRADLSSVLGLPCL